MRASQTDDEARIERAKARLREQESAYEAAQALGKKGYQTQRQSDQIYSSLQTAKHELEVAMIEQERLDIKAPFEGEVLTVPIELGAYVDVNGEVATIVDNHPLVVSVQITQQDITDLKVGQKATVTFATGQKGEGKIRYIAARAAKGRGPSGSRSNFPIRTALMPDGIAPSPIPWGPLPRR